MDSEVPVALADKVHVMPDVSVNRSSPRKKNHGKIPKRVHKAEREKLKREHLNELFLELANALELSHQNNGKSFILNEATRLLRDMLTKIEGLKKENGTLLSESQYVTMEKNELRDENSVLEAQIEKLQGQIEGGVPQSKPDLNAAPSKIMSHFSEDPFRLPALEPTLQHAPVVGPLYVIPLASDTAQPASEHAPNVSKPHARYPTPTDSWPSQLLRERPEAGKELQLGSSNRSSSSARD